MEDDTIIYKIDTLLDFLAMYSIEKKQYFKLL